jgi:hypothetical protein
VLGIQVGDGYESVAKLWLCNKKYGVCNVFTSALCWSLWKLRNSLCFLEESWTSMRALWRRMVPMIRSLRVLIPLRMAGGFDRALASLENAVWAREQVQWRPTLDDQDDAGRMFVEDAGR